MTVDLDLVVDWNVNVNLTIDTCPQKHGADVIDETNGPTKACSGSSSRRSTRRWGCKNCQPRAGSTFGFTLMVPVEVDVQVP